MWSSARESAASWTEAVAECQAALRLNPRSAEAYSNLGDAWRAGGNVPEAIAAFRAALQLNPGLAAAREALVQLEAQLPAP